MVDTALMVAYCNSMEEVKFRIGIAESILNNQLSIGHPTLDAEVACLQLRRCLELIAFGSLIAHKEKYAEVHAEFAADWNAKRLLNKLEKINPSFYPEPSETMISGT